MLEKQNQDLNPRLSASEIYNICSSCSWLSSLNPFTILSTLLLRYPYLPFQSGLHHLQAILQDAVDNQLDVLQNSTDRKAWQVTAHGVTKSQTRLRGNIYTFDPLYLMDREAWHSAVHGVKKNWTRLSN